jgi:hypothetical protein
MIAIVSSCCEVDVTTGAKGTLWDVGIAYRSRFSRPVRRIRHDVIATAQDLKNASRSALIVSAFVVGIPCGKPL